MKEEIRKTFYENGNIETERSYVDGVEHGPAKGWFENGELSFESFKKDGMTHGLVKNYHENGKLRLELEFIMGKNHGHQKYWFENGKLKSEGQKKNGEFYGYWNVYTLDERGPFRYRYKNGELVFVKELNPKTSKNNDFKNTIKFTEELKKYIDSHNDTAVIEVFPSNGGVWEEYIYRGTWNSKKFKMKASIPLKNADYQYDGNLSEFIEEIGNKKITELDDSNLNLELLGDSGGSWQVDEVTWEPALNVEEEFEVDEYDLVDFEMDYDEDDFIFGKGCIYEIKVTIDDKIIKLVK